MVNEPLAAGWQPLQAVRAVARALAAAGCEDAAFDARALARFVLGCEPALAGPLTAQQAQQLEQLCARRCGREPLQYLLGRWPFLDFELAVGPGVLCPRADTEVVAQQAAALAAQLPQPQVLDLCAGSGCLALAVKRLCPQAAVTAVEKSPAAFGYLVRNARCALAPDGWRMEGRAAQSLPPAITAVQGDLFVYWQTLPEGGLDLITANPPYLTAAEMAALQPEAAREPAMALAGGADGLDFYRALAAHYMRPLRPGGALVVEIGWQQRAAVEQLLAQHGWQGVHTVQDLAGNDRCVCACRPAAQ